MKQIPKIMFLFILLTIFLSSSSCEMKKGIVTIHYEQYAACDGYSYDLPTGEHVIVSAGEGAYVIFKITSIDNTKPNAVDYNFNPMNLNTIEDPNSTGGGYLAQGDVLTTLGKFVVPAGTSMPVNGYVAVVSYAHEGNSYTIAEKGVSLWTKSSPSVEQGVVVLREESQSGPPWGTANENCKQIHF